MTCVGLSASSIRLLPRKPCAPGSTPLSDDVYQLGPDNVGIFKSPGLVLGMRRLSIIDLEGGHQPKIDDEGNAFVFNSGNYNHFEQRIRELQTYSITTSTKFSAHRPGEIPPHD